jgi:hypothetical protein
LSPVPKLSIMLGTHAKTRGGRPRVHGMTAFCFPKYG